MKLKEKYAYWKGVPREEINWHPFINEDKCVGCGMCITTCGREVFGYDFEKQKSYVANPYNCMVGCTSCETWCVYHAISFPDKNLVRDFIKRKNLLQKAKSELNKFKNR